MNQLTEATQFLREFLQNMGEVGALFPTSRYAADALAAESARHLGPKRILEVGAGTGAITVRLARLLNPGDRLVVCEINATFVELLQARFAKDPILRSSLPHVEFYTGSVLDLPAGEGVAGEHGPSVASDQRFDYIISAIPFNNCPPEFVDQVLHAYRRLLKPGGVLSYIEYIGGRTLKQVRGNDPHLERRLAVYRRYQGPFEYRRDIVYRNLPPAWIHFLRFQESDLQAALARQPEPPSHQLTLPALALDQEALPWLTGAALLSWLLHRLAPKRAFWWLPAFVGVLIAAFFRDPQRKVVLDEQIVYGASDGVVLAVEEVKEERFGEQRWLRVAVFLSLLDPHVNRAPIAGKVVALTSVAGGFVDARHPNAAQNHSLYTVIEGVHGPCLVAQRTGLIARRIVNRCRPGQPLAQGEKFGLIRFGSRTDVYIPADQAEALVQVGDPVVAGETPLMRYR